MRGNRAECVLYAVATGSIPACAGEPQGSGRYEEVYPVYPRVCGGTNDRTGRCHLVRGLSPRVRGNPDGHLIEPVYARSIPACAGEPTHPGVVRLGVRVYPRVCGGPAHAASSHPLILVYPRVCGGTGLGMPCLLGRPGLSPRVRGNRVSIRPANPPPRSIPACAREPMPENPQNPQVRVYPRVCGGTYSGCRRRYGMRGLSPRVRGNPLHYPCTPEPLGSIPACAGEPDASARLTDAARVYPRVCGGTYNADAELGRLFGLSPRVRGNP